MHRPDNRSGTQATELSNTQVVPSDSSVFEAASHTPASSWEVQAVVLVDGTATEDLGAFKDSRTLVSDPAWLEPTDNAGIDQVEMEVLASRRARAVKLTRIALLGLLAALATIWVLHGHQRRDGPVPQRAAVAPAASSAATQTISTGIANTQAPVALAVPVNPTTSLEGAKESSVDRHTLLPIPGPGSWSVKSVDAKGVMIQFREGQQKSARRIVVGQSFPNGDVLQSVRPSARSYSTNNATVSLAPPANSSPTAPNVGNSAPSVTVAAGEKGEHSKPAKLEKEVSDKPSKGRRMEQERLARQPTAGVSERSDDTSALPVISRSPPSTAHPPRDIVIKEGSASTVTAAELSEAKATNNIETVSASKADVVRVDSDGVVMKSGAKVRIGARFTSGERLLSVDPATQQIITNNRTILLF